MKIKFKHTLEIPGAGVFAAGPEMEASAVPGAYLKGWLKAGHCVEVAASPAEPIPAEPAHAAPTETIIVSEGK